MMIQRVQLSRLRLQPLQALGAVLSHDLRVVLRRVVGWGFCAHERLDGTEARELVACAFFNSRPRQYFWHFELLLRNHLLRFLQ